MVILLIVILYTLFFYSPLVPSHSWICHIPHRITHHQFGWLCSHQISHWRYFWDVCTSFHSTQRTRARPALWLCGWTSREYAQNRHGMRKCRKSPFFITCPPPTFPATFPATNSYLGSPSSQRAFSYHSRPLSTSFSFFAIYLSCLLPDFPLSILSSLCTDTGRLSVRRVYMDRDWVCVGCRECAIYDERRRGSTIGMGDGDIASGAPAACRDASYCPYVLGSLFLSYF